MQDCETLAVVNFNPIMTLDAFLFDFESSDLSSDQKYLAEICQAITSGKYSKNLQAKYPGNMSHSRWLTTSNRILRLYASKDCPSDNLIALTTFVIRVYALTWFDIKRSSICQNGAMPLWSMITRSRYLAEDLKKVHDTVIQRNAYYAHQENLLIAIIS